MPELCADPAPEETALIEPWARHDVYLGMCSGAKGVMIWSLFPRGGVKRTWKTWYDAYARCGRELGSERHLGEVFLFGEPRTDLRVAPADGRTATSISLGGAALEEGTTTAAEREVRKTDVPDFTVRDLAFGTRRYLFVVNSRGSERKFSIAGWPAGTRFTNAFTGAPLSPAETASITLPAWGVAGIVAEAGTDR
jgi:hypothetical protein